MSKLSRILSLVLALTLIVSFAAFAGADQLEDIKARGYIVIATEGDWSPWTYRDETTKELTGYDIEIGKAIAEYLGVEARFAETKFDAILAGIDSKRFDIACNGIGITEERAQKYDFSTPYAFTRKVLVVRIDNDSIKSFEDLKGKKTANTSASTYAALGEKYGAEVVGVDTLANTIQLVIQRRVDATINSQVTINDYFTEHPDAPLKVVAETEGDLVVIPVRKGDDSATLLAAINEVLEMMREDGRLSELSMRFFNGLDLSRDSAEAAEETEAAAE
ncbi:MAG: transporter substrate-binding domain-containing protein [Clostridia bacterium]|nr:transporter substrate-binding domain-containing protein [Clostridia bacterium]